MRRRRRHAWFRVQRRTPDVVIVGGSLTVGERASDRGRGYARLVLDSLASESTGRTLSRVISVPGARIAHLPARHLQVASGLVVVEVGSNDWLGHRVGGEGTSTDLDEFAEMYVHLLDRVDDGRTAAVICLGIWGSLSGRSASGAAREDYDSAIRTACTGRGAVFVPLWPFHDDPECRGPVGRRTPFGPDDGIHPNDHGHLRIAEAVLAAASSAAATAVANDRAGVEALTAAG